MSRIYFHSPSGDAEVLGSERAHMGWLCQQIAMSAADADSPHGAERIASLLRPDHYMAGHKPFPDSPHVVDQRWAQAMNTALNGYLGDPLQWKGTPIGGLSLTLNTAVALGGDEVKLAARLHGQCEIHAYVEGSNRNWLADMVQSALAKAVFRPSRGDYSTGWDSVITLLRSRDDEPVVTSYSVCDSFPNPSVGDWLPPWPEGVPRSWDALTEEQTKERSDREEAWYELESEEQWRISLEGLRAGTGGLELKPDNWNSFKFRHGLSYLDLMAADYASRLDASELGEEEGNE